MARLLLVPRTMARALVIYESMFGNARAIAQAITEGLRETMEADSVEVGEAPIAIDPRCRLLVVGGPTHMLTTTRPSSRARAARTTRVPLVSRGIGLREWLAQVRGTRQVSAVAFDTRLERPRWLRWFRSAAAQIEVKLRARGFEILASAQSFFVASDTGPLLPNEVERARDWGRAIARAHAATAARLVQANGCATPREISPSWCRHCR